MTRPNIQIPKEFAINGEKSDFTQEKMQTGFDKLNPDIFAGDNINKFIDDTYKGLNGVLDLYNGVVLHEMTTTYDDKAVVGKFIENNFKLYRSLVNDNTGHEVTETEYWEEVALGGGGSSLPIGSTIVLDKALSYEESQGLALQGTYVYKTAVAGERYGYPDFYNTYVGYKNNATATQTTLGSSTITIYNNANGLKFYDIADKGVIDTFFNSTGVADFYGIDEENERIFLPRNNKYWQFTTNTNEVNNYVEAGLPDHNHTYMTVDTSSTPRGDDRSGCYNKTVTLTTGNASVSNPIYGKYDTVHVDSSKKLLYYVVGNTVSDTSWVDVVTQVQGGVKDLEDKTQEGIERLKASSNALTTTQITNCITEIPQDIKLELKDGTLTLKAGSKVYVPNGFEADGTTPTFSEVIINSDKSIKQNFDTNDMFLIVYIKPNGTQLIGTGYKGSTLTSQPTPVGDYKVHYITSENKIFWDATGEEDCLFSLPIAIVNRSATVGYTSIEQTFNGFGYIGSTVFVLPNVKGLIPNGRNADGTLNNIEFSTSKVITYTHIFSNNYTGRLHYFIYETDAITDNTGYYDSYNEPVDWNYQTWFNEKENKLLYKQNGEIFTIPAVMFCSATLSNNSITSFNPKLPFRAVDYSDSSTVSGWGMPSNKFINLTLGAAGATYTSPVNGWVQVTGKSTSNQSWIDLHNKTTGIVTHDQTYTNQWGFSVYLPVRRGDTFSLNWDAKNIEYFKIVYAEGEV